MQAEALRSPSAASSPRGTDVAAGRWAAAQLNDRRPSLRRPCGFPRGLAGGPTTYRRQTQDVAAPLARSHRGPRVEENGSQVAWRTGAVPSLTGCGRCVPRRRRSPCRKSSNTPVLTLTLPVLGLWLNASAWAFGRPSPGPILRPERERHLPDRAEGEPVGTFPPERVGRGSKAAAVPTPQLEQ
jgi:hypothetical protein